VSSGITNSVTRRFDQLQRSRAQAAKSIVVTAIVAVTATPYAAARFVERLNASTSPIAAIIKPQLMELM